MRSKRMFTILALGLLVSLAQVGKPAPMGTAFTYQGRLMDANDPADGLYGFEFKLYDDDDVGGIQQGSTVTIDNVDVIDGYFTVELDFNNPNVFNGQGLWLEIGIRSDSSSPFTKLNPRQQVTPSPYAIYAQTAGGGDDLGNHTATQNINLNGHYLSGDGGNDGVYVANDGKVGIGTSGPGAKLEIIQNIWTDILKVGLRTSTNRLILSSGGTWASISGSTTNRDDIVIQHSTGNVGIGSTNPSEKLDVDGNIDVSSNQIKNYYGFPRPNYDSGWVAISQNQSLILSHGIGGDPDDYVVDVQGKDLQSMGVNSHGFGSYVDTGITYSHRDGFYWHNLNSSYIRVLRLNENTSADQIRVRIWVYN